MTLLGKSRLMGMTLLILVVMKLVVQVTASPAVCEPTWKQRPFVALVPAVPIRVMLVRSGNLRRHLPLLTISPRPFLLISALILAGARMLFRLVLL